MRPTLLIVDQGFGFGFGRIRGFCLDPDSVLVLGFRAPDPDHRQNKKENNFLLKIFINQIDDKYSWQRGLDPESGSVKIRPDPKHMYNIHKNYVPFILTIILRERQRRNLDFAIQAINK